MSDRLEFSTGEYDLTLEIGGVAGIDGKTIRNGNGAPNNSIGYNGDYYYDKQNLYFYGPKANDAWPEGFSVAGPYHLWLLEGNTGTEADYLQWLADAQIDEVTPYVEQAATSAANAATSEQNALTYKNNAATSATDALNSKNAAATSASSAQSSATTATTQAGIATTQAGISTTQAGVATTQADIATTKADEASDSADTASTQAGIATTKASEASTSADVASTASITAGNKAIDALNSANDAAASATEAFESAEDAATSAATAQAASDAIIDSIANVQGSMRVLTPVQVTGNYYVITPADHNKLLFFTANSRVIVYVDDATDSTVGLIKGGAGDIEVHNGKSTANLVSYNNYFTLTHLYEIAILQEVFTGTQILFDADAVITSLGINRALFNKTKASGLATALLI